MGTLEKAAKEMADLERSLDQAIRDRDNAEECLSHIYYLVTGRSPEWSNKFGYPQAIEDIEDVMAALKAAAKTGLSVASAECQCPVGMHSVGCKNR